MKIQISKRFSKDVQAITDQRILQKIRRVLEQALQANNLADIAELEAMSGYCGYYRIKFDYRYRMGVYCDSDCLQFLRVGYREDFYKKFP